MKNSYNLIIALFLIFSTSAMAQLKYGIKGGVNFTKMSLDIKDSEVDVEENMKIGFNIGATAIYTINEKFDIQSGLFLINKGSKLSYTEEDIEYAKKSTSVNNTAETDITYSTYYLEIPVNVVYKINKFQLFAGPYMAFGLTGNMEIDYSYGGESGSESYKLKPKSSGYSSDDLEDDEEAFRMFDYGFNFGIGYKLGPILINAEYMLGLGNLNVFPEGEDYGDESDYKIKNNGFTLSTTYMFGK